MNWEGNKPKGMQSKIYNLKTEYNWRGDVAELLAKYRFNAFRTKGYEYKRPFGATSKQASFLKKHWGTIDLYGFDERMNLGIYEIKSRSEGVTRKPDLTLRSSKCYKEAERLGIKVSFVYVHFLNNWNFRFEVIPYNVNDFKINEGGWYRR